MITFTLVRRRAYWIWCMYFKRPSHGKLKLANSCWQAQVGVCERRKNSRQARWQSVGDKYNVFAGKSSPIPEGESRGTTRPRRASRTSCSNCGNAQGGDSQTGGVVSVSSFSERCVAPLPNLLVSQQKTNLSADVHDFIPRVHPPRETPFPPFAKKKESWSCKWAANIA